MVFASPVFLFLFLPLVLLAYLLLPPKARGTLLLLASIVFYGWGEWKFLPLIGASCIGNWLAGRYLGAPDRGARTRYSVFRCAIIANVAGLITFKYSNLIVHTFNEAISFIGQGTGIPWNEIALPIGISFFTFHAISYVADVYRGTARPARNLSVFSLYLVLFPQLIAGPIIRWHDIEAQFGSELRCMHLDNVSYGVRRIIYGLAKKVLIANSVGKVADTIFDLSPSVLGASTAWLGVLAYAIQIYFDFSGYSDIAIGLMRIFGFKIRENFDLPYQARSIREFWTKWNISLTSWLRDYIYIPLGGGRFGTFKTVRNLWIVFILSGVWHGANWTFVAWGAWHGVFITFEHLLTKKLPKKSSAWGQLYAVPVVFVGWVLFRSRDLSYALSFFQTLIHPISPDPLYSISYFLTPSSTVAILFGSISLLPVERWGEKSKAVIRFLLSLNSATGTLVRLGYVGWYLCLLTVSAAFLAARSYNPFIYFRF